MKTFNIFFISLIILLGLVNGEKTLRHKYKKHKNTLNGEEKTEEKQNVTDITAVKYTGLDANNKPLAMPAESPDSNHDFQTNLHELNLVLQNHGMTKVELQMIFRICDINSDGALNNEEWTNFRTIFFLPFEACDTNHDYLLKKEEIQKCLSSQYEFRFVNKGEYEAMIPEILEILQVSSGSINFAGYLYMRRTALGWRECVPGTNLMSRAYYKCATGIATMGHSMKMGDINISFTISLRVQGLSGKTSALTYAQFLRICWAYNLFQIFDVPIADGQVTLKEFQRGIDDGILPTKCTTNMIETMFQALDGNNHSALTFGTFVVVQMWYDKFMTAQSGNSGLNWSEFCNFITSKPLKFYIMNRIDKAIIGLTTKELAEASASPPVDSSLSEKDYIMLLQKISKKHQIKHKKKGEKDESACPKEEKTSETKPNNAAREILFNVLDVNNNKEVSFDEFIVFLKYAYTFYYLDYDFNGRVDSNEINERLVDKAAPIPLTSQETEKLKKFQNEEVNTYIDLLKYLSYNNGDKIFQFDVHAHTKTIVDEDVLKAQLKRIDLELIPRDLAVATLGIPGRPNSTYNWLVAFKVSLQTHCNAIQIKIESNKKDS